MIHELARARAHARERENQSARAAAQRRAHTQKGGARNDDLHDDRQVVDVAEAAAGAKQTNGQFGCGDVQRRARQIVCDKQTIE